MKSEKGDHIQCRQVCPYNNFILVFKTQVENFIYFYNNISS